MGSRSFTALGRGGVMVEEVLLHWGRGGGWGWVGRSFTALGRGEVVV